MRTWLLSALFCLPVSAAPLILEGEVPEEGPAYFRVPFEVSPGTREVEVRHSDLSDANILDFGVEDPAGMRGWGGGEEEAAVIGDLAASRSYLAGPVPAGTWNVLIGKAKLAQTPARYRLEIELRTTPRLAPQPERAAYSPPPSKGGPARWLAGDFHVHSSESGDGDASMDDVATYAEGRVLDFVALTEHNTTSQLQWLSSVQARHPTVLLLPSVELTTYAGHATAVGATQPVDFRMGLDGADMAKAAAALHAQGAVFTLAHPVLDLGNLCIGCPWRHPIPAETGAIEISTGGWRQSGVLFAETAMAYWDRLSKKGVHLTALAGSDDHRAGEGLGQTESPIGEATTMVFAREKSLEAILEGIREGRTVVKLQSPADPMIQLDAAGDRQGDTVAGDSVALTVLVSGARTRQLRLVKNGEPQPPVEITSSEFTYQMDLTPPESGEDFWRAEVLFDGRPRTVTSNLWVTRRFPVARGQKAIEQAPASCTCGAASGPSLGFLLAALLFRRRRARGQGMSLVK